MKALLKTGEWVEIETTHLFHDQYNTKDSAFFRLYGHKILFDECIRMGEGLVYGGINNENE